jgi:hypothetical protein
MSSYSQSPRDDSASRQLAPALRAGETLLWSGRPDPRVRFTSSDALLIPFSLMWGGFAFFWESQVVRSDAPVLFRLWGIPFVLVGCYFIFGRFIYKSRRKTRTAYGLTKGRALISVGATLISDMPLATTPTSVSHGRDGEHVSIVFGQQGYLRAYAMNANSGMDVFNRGRGPSFAFYDVANPNDVLSALDQARGPSSS